MDQFLRLALCGLLFWFFGCEASGFEAETVANRSALTGDVDCNHKPPSLAEIGADAKGSHLANQWSIKCGGAIRDSETAAAIEAIPPNARQEITAAMPNVVFSTDNRLGTLASLSALNWQSSSADSFNAGWEFWNKFEYSVREMLGATESDDWLDEFVSGGAAGQADVLVLKRIFDGIPVMGNYIHITVLRSQKGTPATVSGVAIGFTPDVPSNRVPTVMTKSAEEAAEAIKLYGQLVGEPELVYWTRDRESRLTWYGVFENKLDDPTVPAELVPATQSAIFLDALTFELLDIEQRTSYTTYSGQAKARATNPHDPFPDATAGAVGKRYKALPNISIADYSTSHVLTVDNGHKCLAAADCAVPCYWNDCASGKVRCCTPNACGNPDDETRQATVRDASLTYGYGVTQTAYNGTFSRTDDDVSAYVDNNRTCGHDATCATTTAASETTDGCLAFQVEDFTYPLSLTNPVVTWVSSDNTGKKWPGRRMEAFSLLNISSRYMHDDLGLATYPGIGLTYYPNSARGTNCSGGGGGLFSASGDANTQGPSINIQMPGGHEDPTNCSWYTENVFRFIAFHEFSHSVHQKMIDTLGGGRPSDCYNYQIGEGWANFGAAAISAGEVVGNGVRRVGAYRKFPSDDENPDLTYTHPELASAFTSVFLDYYLYFGYAATETIGYGLPTYIGQNPMVGECTTAGDYTTCPTGSLYRKLIDVASSRWYVGSKQRYEVAKAFHNHITDAYINPNEPNFTNCDNGWWTDTAFQTFPYPDEVTDHNEHGLIMPVEKAPYRTTNDVTFTEINRGPDQYESRDLWFTDANDQDKWNLFVRPGESFKVETVGLASGSDTTLEILDFAANRVGYNDDCVSPDRWSCVTFSNSSGSAQFYRIAARAYSSSTTGLGHTYRIRVTKLADDYYNSQYAAHPVSPDLEFRNGRLETSGDQDHFYTFFPDDGQGNRDLFYSFCTSNAAARFQIWQGATMLTEVGQVSDCENNLINTGTQSLSPGLYRIVVVSPSAGVTGNYKFRVFVSASWPDIASSAYNLDSFPAYPSSGVKMLPAMLRLFSQDEAWFKFSATAGDIVHLDATETTWTSDPKLTLFGPQKMFCLDGDTTDPHTRCDTADPGETLALFIDDNGGTLTNNDASIVFAAPWSGTYYIKAENVGAGGYTLTYYKDHGIGFIPSYLADLGS